MSAVLFGFVFLFVAAWAWLCSAVSVMRVLSTLAWYGKAAAVVLLLGVTYLCLECVQLGAYLLTHGLEAI